jgi:cytochrome c oxidase cbb3-type subunit 3
MSNDPKEPLLLDHNYDGIQELDNNLPAWWLWLLYITIIFSAVYLVYYHVYHAGDKVYAEHGQQFAEYQAETNAAAAKLSSAFGSFEASIPNLKPATEKSALDAGLALYTKNCVACHRADGGGLVGPNLTDDYWVHGSSFGDSVAVIWNGVPDKGMLAWKKQGLKPADVINVASYIYTLRGAKLATPGKPPENQKPATTVPTPSFE